MATKIKNTVAAVFTPKEYEQRRRTIPQSWKRAAGLLKHKKINALAYERQIRREWDTRTRETGRGQARRGRS